MDVREARRAIIAGQSNFIPPAYQRYDYLECTGYNSRIDTGIAGNDNTLLFDFVYMSLDQKDYFAAFGNYDGEDKKCWRLIQSTTSYPRRYTYSTNIRKAGSSTSLLCVSAETGTIIQQKIHFVLQYGRIDIDDMNGYINTANQSDDSTTAVSTKNIAIGALNPTGAGYSYHARFYDKFAIKQNGILIRNYIPVVRKSDSKAGFYDTVNQTFNPSIGNTDFIAGNET